MRISDWSSDVALPIYAVRPRAAPIVIALVGVADEELVDEISLGAHHFDAVVAGFARELRAAHVGLDLPFDAAHRQFARRRRRDRRLDPRCRYRQRRIAVTADRKSTRLNSSH